MTDDSRPADRGKRAVTTDGSPLGRVVEADDDALYVRPDPGLLLGCGSWLTPAWAESDAYRVDEERVVGVGDATVVLAVDAEGRSAGTGARAADDAPDGSDEKESPGGASRR